MPDLSWGIDDVWLKYGTDLVPTNKMWCDNANTYSISNGDLDWCFDTMARYSYQLALEKYGEMEKRSQAKLNQLISYYYTYGRNKL